MALVVVFVLSCVMSGVAFFRLAGNSRHIVLLSLLVLHYSDNVFFAGVSLGDSSGRRNSEKGGRWMSAKG